MKFIPITAESLSTFFEGGDENWSLKQWLVVDRTKISDVTSIAMLESGNGTCEFEFFEDGVLVHHSSVGDRVCLDKSFAYLEVTDSYYHEYRCRHRLEDLTGLEKS
ncbi:MAG: hypothetical protein ACSHYA_19810 [Opitutaceae bacterium]